MILTAIQEKGTDKIGTLRTNYKEIVEKIFEPNTTHLDDPYDVKASWGFTDHLNRKAFIWSYKYYGEIDECNTFSVGGNKELLKELFESDLEFVS